MTNSKSIYLQFILLFTLAVSMVLSGVNAQAPTSFVVGFTGPSPNTLNPNDVFNSGAVIVRYLLYDPLVRYSEKLDVSPDLAESWTMSPDGTEVTFKLVQNAAWHDGTPVTADDVAYTYNLNVEQQFPWMSTYVANVKSAEVVDKYTVKIIMNTPDASALDYMAANVFIIPKHIWSNVPNPGNYTNDNPVGSGPFIFESWVPGQTVVGKANPNYHQGRPKVDRIVFREFTSPSSMVLALQNGEIDLAGPFIPPETVPTLESNPNIKVITSPDVRYWYLNFDFYADGTSNPTLRDKNVRIALLHAVDTAALTDIVYRGYAKPGTTVIPEALTFWHNPNVAPYEFNLTTAAQMLDSGGYKVGSDGIRASSAGVKMSYIIYVPATEPLQLRAAQQIAQWWGQIGVKAVPELIDVDTLLAKIAKYEHDVFLWDWIYAGSPNPWLSIFLTSQLGILNDSGYSNPEYDQLYKDQLAALDQNQRQEIVFKMQQMLRDDAAYGVLYYNDAIEAYRTDKFAGYVVMPGGPLYDHNVYTFMQVYPLAAPTATVTETGTTSTPAPGPVMGTNEMLLAAVVVILLVAIVAMVMRRRSKPR